MLLQSSSSSRRRITSEYARDGPYAMADDDAVAAPQPQKRKLVNINNNVIYPCMKGGELFRCSFPGATLLWHAVCAEVVFWSSPFFNFFLPTLGSHRAFIISAAHHDSFVENCTAALFSFLNDDLPFYFLFFYCCAFFIKEQRADVENLIVGDSMN